MMRIHRLDLTRFGKFTERSLAFPAPDAGAPDLHIIYGPNEAGKSTLMTAWLDLLFGIDVRSPYDFVHDYKAMQIGAVLESQGALQEFRRIKKKTGTLLDGHGAILPDTALLPYVGNLSRDGYRHMFSLNDATIEEGGDAILASKGELGEMLFSASAGLAGLSPRLDVLRQELDAFHQDRKTATRLGEMRRALADLTKAEKDADTPIQKLRQLQSDLAQAERQLADARASREGAAKQLATLDKIKEAVPRRQRLAEKQAAYALVSDLYHADEALPLEVQKLLADTQALSREIADIQQDLLNRKSVIAAEDQIADPQILAQSAAILAAEALRHAHDSALDDLPRRKDEREELVQKVQRHLSDLGKSDHDAAAVIISPARLAKLRVLLRDRSGIVQAQQSALAELKAVENKRVEAQAALGDESGQDADVIANYLSDLRVNDPVETLRRATITRDAARQSQDLAMAALYPWQGDIGALQALPAPHMSQLAHWATAEQDLARQRDAAERSLHHLKTTAEEAEKSLTSGETSGVGLRDAALSRARRESMWAEHRANASLASATAFEQAMREDDQIQSLVLEAMVEARREAVARMQIMQLQADITEAQNLIARLEDAREQLAEEITASCQSLGLPPMDLTGLSSWCGLRAEALATAGALRVAEDAHLRESSAVTQAARQLAGLIGEKAAGADDLPLLLAQARSIVDQAGRRADARKHFEALKKECAERLRLATSAQETSVVWQKEWDAAALDTPLAESSDDAGEILDRLDFLAQDFAKLTDIEDRISKMELNVARFADAAAKVMSTLTHLGLERWSDLLGRLNAAENARALAMRERDALTRVAAKAQALETQHVSLTAAEADIARRVGWIAGQGDDLAQHIARCCDAARLRAEMKELEEDLTHIPSMPEASGDLDMALHEANQILATADAKLNDTMAAQIAAKAALDAVGSDSQLTRISAEKEALLLDMKDKVRSHLQSRMALMTFEAGLRRFRDSHQSDMLTRASDAFSRLTGGAYRGLAAQPHAAREMLVAQTHDGLSKDASQLSKGTRFQLYLALRIAGYHSLADSRAMVPFIADDIMETFDDDRALATFGLMGEMAHRGQVIYLTHHRHLCDLARQACPSARITML